MIDLQKPDYGFTPAHPLRKSYEYCLRTDKQLPCLSIVTPFYNTGLEFHETALSIFRQSFQQWEWLIVNDGSTEQESLQILSKYRQRDPRIRIVDHPTNRGLSAARNSGISQAQSEYVLLLDSDDLLEPTAAEKWWWYLETHPESSFVSSYHVAFGSSNFLWTGGFHDGVMNTERNRISMMCLLRKTVIQAVGGFDESILGGLEDWDFWMRCASYGYWGATIPEFLAWYRNRTDHSDRWNNLQNQRFIEFRKLLQAKYPNLYQGEFPDPIELVDLDFNAVHLDIPKVNQQIKAFPHLLIILPWLSVGGAERFILNLIDQLIQRDWTITIVTTAPSENQWLAEFEKRISDVFVLPDFVQIKDYPRFLGYLIQSRNIDAILVQGSHEGYSLLPVLRQMFPKLPIFDYVHFVTPDWMDGGFPRLSLFYKDGIDLTITSCQQVKQWMVENGIDDEHLRVSPIGVDAERWKPDLTARQRFRQDHHIQNDDVVLLYAARLEAQKQPFVFANTLHLLYQQGVPFRAIVAGDGSLRTALEKKIQAYNLEDKVSFLGVVPDDEMPELMAASDIFFLPSQNEGISSALYEAMAAGLLVVGADVGGQAELATPQCSILIHPLPEDQQPAIYAKVLSEQIENESLRKRMGAAGRERILHGFTLDSMGSSINNILSEVIKLKGDRQLIPRKISPEEEKLREAQYIIEYLQSRKEWRSLEQQYKDIWRKYSELIQPKPASYWFYLWLRQIMLPLYQVMRGSSIGSKLIAFQKKFKQLFIKE